MKVASRRRHLLFDVPVIGPGTIEVMSETRTTALAVDAGRTLMLDRDELLAKADDGEDCDCRHGALPEDEGK